MTKSKKKKEPKPEAPEAEAKEKEEELPAEESAEESVPAETAAPEEEALETRLLRLQADFDNFRKRTVREKGEWTAKANEDFFLELLPVLDHFEMGLNTALDHHAESSVVEGFKLVYDQLIGLCRKFGIEPVDAEGKAFDPHLHEAITHMPSPDQPEDTVMAQTRRGYTLRGKLLRAAQVVVSSGPPAEAPDETAEVPES